MVAAVVRAALLVAAFTFLSASSEGVKFLSYDVLLNNIITKQNSPPQRANDYTNGCSSSPMVEPPLAPPPEEGVNHHTSSGGLFSWIAA
ncbi:hypothetical protein OROGR_015421 [Orobanche gracilis]